MTILGPSRDRMNRQALDVLAEARDRALHEPIETTAAIRLAFSWLTLNKIAEPWQVKTCWEAMTKDGYAAAIADPGYVRRRDMNIHIDAWERRCRKG